MIGRAGIGVAAAVALSQSAWADDSVRGRALAQHMCAACHNVRDGPRLAGRRAPSFGEISRSISLNASQLAIYLAFGHTPMGDRFVAVGEAGDLAAYIVSLRRR